MSGRLGDKLAVKTQAPSRWLIVDPLAATPLPPTVRQRRWERAGALALAAIPIGLVFLGLMARLWGLELAPFGEAQAAELAGARRLAASTDWRDWARSTELVVVLHAAMLAVSDRVEFWLAIRAVMDAAAIWLVYLTGRTLAGRPVGVGAAAILALSAASWTATRDLAAHSSPLLLATALWLSTRLLRDGGIRWAVPLTIVTGAMGRLEPSHVAFGLPLIVTIVLSQPRTATVVVVGVLYGALVTSPMVRLTPGTPSLSSGDLAAFGPAFGLSLAEAATYSLATAPVPVLEWMAGVCTLAALLVGVAVILRSWRTEPARLLPLLWGFAPTLGLLVLGRPSLHVAVTTGPAVALVLALSLAVPATLWRGVPRYLARAAVAVLIITHGASIFGFAFSTSGPGAGATATLGAWTGVAAEAVDAAERTGATELLVLPVEGPYEAGAAVLGSLIGPRLALRAVPPDVVPLPVERDALYLLLPGASEASALVRPSARHAAVAMPGASEPVRLISLRPRPAHQWLARDDESATAQFADGSFVLVRRAR
jgi:hypothetical protein